MITVVNPSHWLDEDGELPSEPRLRARALRVAQCIEAGGPLRRGETRETLIPCRRRPEGKACPGLLWVLKQNDDAIHSFCQVCTADEFLIYEWEETQWAEGPMEPMDIAAMLAESDQPERREAQPTDLDTVLGRALTLIGSTLSTADVRRIVERSAEPSAMVQEVIGSAAAPPSMGAVERLLPVLMDLWNATPRAELGGRSPAVVHAARTDSPRTASIGRNAPCPCGSGRKYKKCCLLGIRN